MIRSHTGSAGAPPSLTTCEPARKKATQDLLLRVKAMSRIIIWIMLIVGSVGASPVAAETDERTVAFNSYCRNCHSLKKNDQRLGPSLHSVFGARAGQVAGYRGYSGALDGLVWDIQTLDRYLADPASVSASTSMIYPPVRDPADRKRIIELLKSRAGR